MEATIIKLAPADTGNVVVRTASFEEAFGDYSEARGRGRARRKKRKLERIENKREVKTARRKKKADRQEERIERRRTRKAGRQDIRGEQQEARMGRRERRLEMRQQRGDARNLRRMTKEQGDQERENYALEQELYRDSLAPQDEQGGGYSDEQGGGYADEQGGGYASSPQGGGYTSQGDWASEPEGMDDQWGYGQKDEGVYDGNEDYAEEGAYGDDNRYDSPYVQEDTEFGGDDSYFNVEGMDGKLVVSPKVKDLALKLKNNERAYNDLSQRRITMAKNGGNTKGIDIQIKKCYGRICELRQNLENYASADGNPRERSRRKKEVGLALGRFKRRRKMGRFGGSEVPVDKDLNPDFKPNRIEIPAKSGFDAYSDLGRPVIIDGVVQSDYADYSDDLLTDSAEPTTVELYSNADGGSSSFNSKTLISVAVGIGVGALAIYVAKKKGWI